MAGSLPAGPHPSPAAPRPFQVWRNHAGLVEALLEAGADPDARDAESGWSALHRALHWGQLRAAAALLAANASLGLPDWRGRSPLDLLSAELKEFLAPAEGEGEGLRDGDVFAWGAPARAGSAAAAAYMAAADPCALSLLLPARTPPQPTTPPVLHCLPHTLTPIRQRQQLHTRHGVYRLAGAPGPPGGPA